MKIINYNKTKHDIYTFDESAMVLCTLPTLSEREIQGELILPLRVHAQVTGWNYSGLWNTNIDNAGIPDWSGLSVRSRGSNLYAAAYPTRYLWPGLETEFRSGSYSDKFKDITNWNNALPVFILISKKHFIACEHFAGTYHPTGGTPTAEFNILDKEGNLHTITGDLIASGVSDTNIYRITSITGAGLPAATEINSTHKIKIYQILNISDPIARWQGLRIWHQLNNGMFVTTTCADNSGYIDYHRACAGLATTPTVASGLPILAALTASPTWFGDSGSPILATYNGETYLIGMSDGGDSDYSRSVSLEFLRSTLLNDDGTTITLASQSIPVYNIATPLSVASYKSRFTMNTDLLIYNDTYNYVNMIYHGFYGGTSLQSQELNELQENIQNQLSLSNKLIGNWLEYTNNINTHGESLGGIYTADGLTADILVPLNPENITDNAINTHKDWYLYKDNNGYQQFIALHHETVSHFTYYNNIKSRIVSGHDPNWAILRDTDNTLTFDAIGANRIQLFYNPSSTQ